MTLEATLTAVNDLKAFIDNLNNPKIRFGVLANRYGTEFLLCGIKHGGFYDEETKEISEKFPATGYIPNSGLHESGNYGNPNVFLTQRIPGAIRVTQNILMEIILRSDIRDWMFPKISIWHFDEKTDVYEKLMNCTSLKDRVMKEYHPASWSRWTGIQDAGYTYFVKDVDNYAHYHPFISHNYDWR